MQHALHAVLFVASIFPGNRDMTMGLCVALQKQCSCALTQDQIKERRESVRGYMNSARPVSKLTSSLEIELAIFSV